MTKVNILRLDSTTENDTAATLNINTNFENIQKALENTLSRDGTVPNYMDANLDMNSYKIINAGKAVEDNDVVNYKQFKDEIGEATVAASSAAASAAQAASSAQSALVSSTNAISSVRGAENVLSYAQNLLTETQEYVNTARDDIANTASTNEASINKTVADAQQEINTAIEEGKAEVNSAIDDATMRLSDTIEESVEEVKTAALEAAQEAINDAAAEATAIVVEYANNEVKPQLNNIADRADEDAKAAEDWAKTSKIWATGEDAEVNTVAPGEEEHSSRGYADLAMAIANTPEDVPVDASKLLALDVIRGPKGDSGEAEFSGDVIFTGTFDVHSDSNHPVKVTGMAGTSASGFQIVDSNGLGDSDFEHYATGDRYGTRITNHNNTSDTSVSVDLYQTNVGKSVLDATAVGTVLVKDLQVDGADVVKTSGNQTITGLKTFVGKNAVLLYNDGQNTNLTLKDSITTYGNSAVDITQATSNGRNQLFIHFQEGNKWITEWSQDPATKDVKFSVSNCAEAHAPTPAIADNTTKIATTAWVNNKHQVVSALPSSPTAGVFYFIKE